MPKNLAAMPYDIKVNESHPEYAIRVMHERDALKAEVEDLKHDIGRYIQQASALAEEVERLNRENSDLKRAIADCLDESNEPEYHYAGMGCGLEDRGITCRYEAMEYGWRCAMELVYSEVMPSPDLISATEDQSQ